MSIRKDQIILLLGAGASANAGIPTSKEMIRRIEDKLKTNDWKDHSDLYHYIKSSIMYADGLEGDFSGRQYNIERFVSTLAELEKKGKHAIYPFVGSWNQRLLELAGSSFCNIEKLRKLILKELRSWVTLDNYQAASYFSRLESLQGDLQYPLRVFTLNYDMCTEKNCESKIIRGFDENRIWDWRRFEDDSAGNLFLYKMHGSIDWRRNPDGDLTFSDETGRIDEPELIFGQTYKLQYLDPYLFFAYEFRRYLLTEVDLLVIVGYSFSDPHLNGIIGQAMRKKPTRKILTVSRLEKKESDGQKERVIEKWKTEVARILEIKEAQVIVHDSPASEFFQQNLNVEYLSQVLEQERTEDVPF